MVRQDPSLKNLEGLAGGTRGGHVSVGDSLPNLLRGTVDLLVLRALVDGPMHGFGVARWIEEAPGEGVAVEDAAVYQSLHRLERKGLVTAAWGRSENNRRARFYSLTRRGRERFEADARTFRRYARSVDAILATDG